MTVARQVVAGRTYLISRRCTQRQFLLRPDDNVAQIYLYCLGEAALRYDVSLLGFIAMSNHQHVLIRDNRANFPAFLAHLNKMISKAVNALRGRWENLWATEQPNAVYLVDAEARLAKLVYLLANPVIDHLVDRISDWPGASSLSQHLSGRSRTVPRPRVFFRADGKMPMEVILRIERPEGFETLTDAEWVEKLQTALRDAEQGAREERKVFGRSVLGRKAVLRTQPTDSPTTMEPRRNLRPHVACHDRARRRRELLDLLAFRRERWAALVRHLAGACDVLFPHGTYRIRGRFLSSPPPTPELYA